MIVNTCQNYTPEVESFIAALEQTPLGVPFLDQATIDQGRGLIKQTVCAHLTPSHAAAQVRLEQSKALAQIAEEALQTFPAQQEQLEPLSDQERAARQQVTA